MVVIALHLNDSVNQVRIHLVLGRCMVDQIVNGGVRRQFVAVSLLFTSLSSMTTG